MPKESSVPLILQTIPSPPTHIYIQGDIEEILARPRVAIVGSRKVSPYGKAVTANLAGELARQGVAIISGLALGVDAIAHQAALEAGGLTAAVLPTGLDKIYPSSHHQLAAQIVRQGGALLTEYPDGTEGFRGNFVARNRLVSGLSDAVLITEAAAKSGTMHTAGFALKQGRKVLAVPGNITSPMSSGANNLIKEGATPITSSDDVLRALGISAKKAKNTRPVSSNPQEQTILTLIYNGTSDGAELLIKSELDVQLFNQTLTMLEITGQVKSLGNNKWALV